MSEWNAGGSGGAGGIWNSFSSYESMVGVGGMDCGGVKVGGIATAELGLGTILPVLSDRVAHRLEVPG